MVCEVVCTLSNKEQIELVELCREIIEIAPLFQKTMPTGAKFRYLCTSAGQYGWMSDKKGYRYETHHPITAQPFPDLPQQIYDIVQSVTAQIGETIIPQSALINWYAIGDSLGLHVDRTEECAAPVVSISLGSDAKFTVGGIRKTDKKRDIILKSGDVFVMSNEHRYIYHGVKKIIPNTCPNYLHFSTEGRINITIRQVHE